jgi:hypothetical protein
MEMMPRLRRSLALGIVIAALTGLSLSFAWTSPAPEEPREGLVVLEPLAADPQAEVDFRPGDVLVTWRRGTASGLLRWPSGLLEVETEQAPQGPWFSPAGAGTAP